MLVWAKGVVFGVSLVLGSSEAKRLTWSGLVIVFSLSNFGGLLGDKGLETMDGPGRRVIEACNKLIRPGPLRFGNLFSFPFAISLRFRFGYVFFFPVLWSVFWRGVFLTISAFLVVYSQSCSGLLMCSSLPFFEPRS